MPNISITVGGKLYEGWNSYSISNTMEKLVGKFTMSVTDRTDQKNNTKWELRPQDAVTIKDGDDILLTGYIDKVSPAISSTSHSIRISGRSKTSDLVDCSAKQAARKFAFNKTTILQLAEALCSPFGIKVEVQPGTDVSKTFKLNINTSESVFDVLDKKAKELSILLLTNNKGILILGNSDRNAANDALVLGTNVLRGSSEFDYTNRYSEYKVIGQGSAAPGWGSNIQVNAASTDEGVNRFRPLIVQGTGQLNRERAELRANWEANTRAANSETVTLIVQSHRQSNGDIWEYNKLAQVLAPALYINPPVELLITSVTYSLDSNGSLTEINLKNADAYIPDPSAKVKANKKIGWGAF